MILQRGNLTPLTIAIIVVILLHLLIFLLLLHLFLTFFDNLVRKHIIIAIEKSASQDYNTNVDGRYISHAFVIIF
jgi:hypothetical protein